MTSELGFNPSLPCPTIFLGSVTSHSIRLQLIECPEFTIDNVRLLNRHTDHLGPRYSERKSEGGGITSMTIENLDPNTSYTIIAEHGMDLVVTGSVTTFPDPSSFEIASFVFGSCSSRSIYPFHRLKAYETVVKLNPRFLLLLGDNAYMDIHEAIPNRIPFDMGNRQIISDPAVYKALTTIPQFVMFDDHEFRNDFIGVQDPFFIEGLPFWWRYWGVKNPPRMNPNDYYFTFSYGSGVSVFVLQTRLHVVEHVTLLGNEQKRDMKHWLKSSTSAIKIIASPVSFSDDGHGLQFLEERNEIMCFVAQNSIPGVYIVSGDMHYGAVYQYSCNSDENRNVVTEFSASPFQAIPFPYVPYPLPGKKKNHQRVLFSEWAYHFGKIDADPTKKEVQFTLFRWNTIPNDPKVHWRVLVRQESGLSQKISIIEDESPVRSI